MAPRRRNRNEVRRALYAWIVWSPLLAVFGFIAWDAFISIRGRNADYEIGALAAQQRQLVQELDAARSAQSGWTDIRKIAELIKQLNMTMPDPQQIQVVVARPGTPMPETRERPQSETLEMAAAPSAQAQTASNPAAVSAAPVAVLPAMAAAVPAAPAVLVPVTPPQTVPTPVAAAAPADATPNLQPAILDLPKEQITDLDSPDATLRDLLPRL